MMTTMPKKYRIGLFRDGPIARPSTGGAATPLGMVDALVRFCGCEVVLFYCLRGVEPGGGEDPIDLLDLSRAHNHAFPFTGVVCIRPEDFYSKQGAPSLGSLIHHFEISICHFESAQAIEWQSPTVRQYSPGSKIVFEFFDVESILERCTGIGALCHAAS